MRTIARVSVIPWEVAEQKFGVEIVWSNGFHEAYVVGPREAAQAEAARRRAQAQ